MAAEVTGKTPTYLNTDCLKPFPRSMDLMWGAVAGLLVMMGFGFLLRGFASGRMGIVAPVSGVLATAVPVIFSVFSEGLPRPLQLAGFGLALVSIWCLSRPEKLGGRPEGLGTAVLAGLGFGGFFTALDQIGDDAVFWPLAAARLAACVIVVAFVLVRRQTPLSRLPSLPLMLLLGILDVGGNLFFLLASFYPAVTAILAWLVARDHLALLQVFGLALAILAIVLITV